MARHTRFVLNSFFLFLLTRLVAYHVAPNLNAEERRRLIGNDIALLVFLDAPLTSVTTITTALTVTTTTTFNADAQFDVNCLDAFGDVTQLYVIVQPIDGYPQGDYRYVLIVFEF